jgi:hypothetical protein
MIQRKPFRWLSLAGLLLIATLSLTLPASAQDPESPVILQDLPTTSDFPYAKRYDRSGRKNDYKNRQLYTDPTAKKKLSPDSGDTVLQEDIQDSMSQFQKTYRGASQASKKSSDAQGNVIQNLK